MMKFTVTHTCGHEAPHGFSGNADEIRRRQDWLSKQPCQTCWRERQLGEAAAQRAEWNLPPLEGTPEQIAWAEVIRAKAIAHNKDYRQHLLAEAPFEEDPALHELVVTTANTAMAALESEANAFWWLEHRFEVLSHVKQQVVDAIAPVLNSRPH